jgi:hypothetical protein
LGLSESEVEKVRLGEEGERGVRASRRIAQLKIREQSERRAFEEATLLSIQDIEHNKRRLKKKVIPYSSLSIKPNWIWANGGTCSK